MVQPRRKRVRRNVKGERHIDKGKRASGEKKSPPLPCLEKFPVFRRVFDQVPLDVQFHVNTLWLASLFPAINRFRRKNLRELVRRRNVREARPAWEKWCTRASSLLSWYDGETSHVCSDSSRRGVGQFRTVKLIR